MKWNEIAGRIGINFLKIWGRKHVVLSVLLVLSLVGFSYHYSAPTLVSLHLALIPTITLFIVLFAGLIVVEHIEGLKDASEIPPVITQALIGIGIVLGILLYLSGMLFGVFPAPPLPFLFAILFALKVAPYVVLLAYIPPLIGSLPGIKPAWRRLRQKYPFWGIYLGGIAGLLTLSILFMFPQVLVVGGGTRIFLMGGLLLICSGLLAAVAGKLSWQAADVATSVLGFLMIFLGVLLWLGAMGGLCFGSIFAVLGGAHAHSWKPTVHPLKAEKNPRE